MRLDEQLAHLKDFGIRLNPKIKRSDFFQNAEPPDYEQPPFCRLLWTLGGEADRGRNHCPHFSDQVYFVGDEEYTDPDVYAQILHRLAVLCGVDDKLARIETSGGRGLDEGELSFKFAGTQFDIDLDMRRDCQDRAAVRHMIHLIRPASVDVLEVRSGYEETFFVAIAAGRFSEFCRSTGMGFELIR